MRPGTPKFVGERLREAREARGLTCTSLAELIGVSRQAVSQYEKARQSPSPAIMDKICSVLGLPRAQFLHQPREELGKLFFRSFASATKAERAKQLERHKWRRRAVGFIRGYVTFPVANIPQLYHGDPLALTTSAIERIAIVARRHFGLGDGPISDVVLLLENHGGVVVRAAFDARTLDAFSEWSEADGFPYFILSADKRSAVRSRFDICHELGHMMLHRHLKTAANPEYFTEIERQAHRFASAFLAPHDAFIRAFRARSVDDLIDLKRLWRLSISAIARRAWDVGLISKSRYRRCMTEIGLRGWRKREPLDDELSIEQPRLLRRSMDLLLDERIVHRHAFERIGAGSARDVESCLGLAQGYLDDPKKLQFRADSLRKGRKGQNIPGRQIIKITSHLKA